jgi:drug/metabolite transporter (DMT)-like permease
VVYIGEIAGLLTSLCFAVNAVLITKAGQKVGSLVVNRTRVVFALLYLVILNTILYHQPLPFQAGGQRWVWLSLSGVSSSNSHRLRRSILGVAHGVLGAIGQATGLVSSKQGMLGNFSPISGNAIRMLAAVIGLWLITLLRMEAGKTIRTLKENPASIQLLALVALIGPVIGVSLSLLAVQNTAVGVASILTSLSPIFILPISHFYFNENLGWQVIAGTILATIGVTILFLV